MNRDAAFHDAKRLYLESYGDPMVTNTYLKIALVLMSLIAVALALVDLRTIRTFENFRPLWPSDHAGVIAEVDLAQLSTVPEPHSMALLMSAVLLAAGSRFWSRR